MMNTVCIHFSKALRQIVGIKGVNYSTFSSSLSITKLYPGSNHNLTTPKYQQQKESIFSGFIPVDQLQITYSRSSGPGGQNVNKVNTKVDVRFHVETADWMHADTRQKILLQHKNKITKDGFFVIRSEKTRSQQLNLADALERLRAMIWKISESEPCITPETEQRILRQKEKATRVRLAEKRTRSLIKTDRHSPVLDL